MRGISEAGLAALKQMEGYVGYAYDDADPSRPRKFIQPGNAVRGTLSIGYGHTQGVRPGQRVTEPQAEALLRADLAPVQQAIARLITVPLSDGQYAALCSFGYNLGHGTAPGSPLANIAATLNSGDYAGAIKRMQLYCKRRVDGKLVTDPGLVNRRAAEAGLWASGGFVASACVAAEPAPQATPVPAAAGVAAAGILGALTQASPLLDSLGHLAPAVSITLVLITAGLFVLWRKGEL